MTILYFGHSPDRIEYRLSKSFEVVWIQKKFPIDVHENHFPYMHVFCINARLLQSSFSREYPASCIPSIFLPSTAFHYSFHIDWYIWHQRLLSESPVTAGLCRASGGWIRGRSTDFRERWDLKMRGLFLVFRPWMAIIQTFVNVQVLTRRGCFVSCTLNDAEKRRENSRRAGPSGHVRLHNRVLTEKSDLRWEGNVSRRPESLKEVVRYRRRHEGETRV